MDTATEMGNKRRGGSIYEPESCDNSGSDQSIDITGDSRLGIITEGTPIYSRRRTLRIWAS
jgi:hypothetical protein